MYSPRVSLPAERRPYERILSSEDFANQGFSGDNIRTIRTAATFWIALIADSPVDSVKPYHVVNRFANRLVNDFLGTVTEFAGLAHLLTFSFSKSEGGYIRAPFIEGFKGTPVFREYLHFYKTGDPLVLKYLLTFLSFGKKVSYKDEQLNHIAFREWDAVEEKLMKLVLPEFVINLAPVVDLFLQPWDADVFLPVHGGGAVAEKKVRGIEAKNRGMQPTDEMKFLFSMNDIYQEAGIHSYPGEDHSHAIKHGRSSISGVARLKFVPKDIRKTRSICMEPISFMWAQQGVRLWYERALSESVLEHNVFLKDQTQNQFAAKFGSFTTELDTIDLSSASDSVSWDLVKSIFPSKVLQYLSTTRTSFVEVPEGQSPRYVGKFAPMGSALCFPVQTTIYSAVVFLVGVCFRWGVDWREPGVLDGIDLEDLYYRTFRTYLSTEVTDEDHRLHPFYVYGDDIVCDKRITSNVMEALRYLGFKVNVEKSYHDNTVFRESCGIFAYNGSDVTPLVCKVKSVPEEIGILDMVSYIDFANNAYEWGYMNLRKHVIQFVLRHPIKGVKRTKAGLNPILFSSDAEDSCALYTDNPRNAHLSCRGFQPLDNISMHYDLAWELDSFKSKEPLTARQISTAAKKCRPDNTADAFQRDEIRSISVGPRLKRELSEEFDNYRLGVWWRSRYPGSEDGEYEFAEPMTADTLKTGAVWRWTAIPK
jgi:hypothetical protein